jgi:uncharacterized protein YunC (DUF1805 family)
MGYVRGSGFQDRSKIKSLVEAGKNLCQNITVKVNHVKEKKMEWEGLTKEKIQLGLPLLIIKGEKGFLGCGYINVEACNKAGEACAIVTGVKTHEDMLVSDIKAVSEEAKKLGIREGMKGQEALEIFR